MKEKIPAQFQNPLAVSTNANVWTYNTELHDKCPVSNIWELTETKWKGKLAFVDPLTKSTYSDWFNQLEKHGNRQMEEAYRQHFGKDYPKDSKESASTTWIKAIAANAPLLGDGDDPVSDAIGAPGQKAPSSDC